MAPPIDATTVRDAISIAADIARDLGVEVQHPVQLRSTNNAVAWLRPSNVVAKVSVGRNSRLQTELQVAQGLCALGGPAVAPAPELPGVVHRRREFEVTFWRYHAQPPAAELSPHRVALTLRRLHEAL